jgi:2-dehydropantoate 2-reductase
MSVAVVGAGAMGSLFGALLAEAGQKVWLIDVWAEHVNAIQSAGLTVEQEGQIVLICKRRRPAFGQLKT